MISEQIFHFQFFKTFGNLETDFSINLTNVSDKSLSH